MTGITLEPFDAERDSERAAWLFAHSFGSAIEDARQWLPRIGHRTFVVRLPGHDGAAMGTGTLHSMGQFFAGASVPMQGVAGITVAPEARGRGIARELMRLLLLKAHERGAPLSTLYPATQTLYRRVGYEQAGHFFHTHIPAASLTLPKHATADTTTLRPATDADLPRVKHLYRRFASTQNGYLDRNDDMWARVFEPRGVKTDTFIVEEHAELTGSVTMRRRGSDIPDAHGTKSVTITDLSFITPGAGRRLVAFLRDHESTIRRFTLTAGPWHPVLALLTEQRHEVAFKDYWMLRLVDVAAAIAARPAPPGLSARIELDINDDTLPHNAGRFTVEAEGGSARVSKGGSGALRTTARALAAAYSGFASPLTLALTGEMTGPPEDLASLGALFAAQTPALADFF